MALLQTHSHHPEIPNIDISYGNHEDHAYYVTKRTTESSLTRDLTERLQAVVGFQEQVSYKCQRKKSVRAELSAIHRCRRRGTAKLRSAAGNPWWAPHLRDRLLRPFGALAGARRGGMGGVGFTGRGREGENDLMEVWIMDLGFGLEMAGVDLTCLIACICSRNQQWFTDRPGAWHDLYSRCILNLQVCRWVFSVS